MNFDRTSRSRQRISHPPQYQRSLAVVASLGLLFSSCRALDVPVTATPPRSGQPKLDNGHRAAVVASVAMRPAGPWSLQQLLAVSTEVSPDLSIVRAHVAQADAAVEMARSAFGLRVDVGFSITETDNPVMAFMGELNAEELDLSSGFSDTPWTAHSTASLRASTILWDGGRREAREDAAVAGRTAAASMLKGTQLAVEARVVALYMAVLEARSLGQAADHRLHATGAALEVAQARAESGVGLQSEVLSLDARLEAVRESALIAKSAERFATDSLRILLGLSRSSTAGLSFEVAGSLASHDSLLEKWISNLDGEQPNRMQQMAERNRPDVQALREQIAAREAAWNAAKLSGGPTLSAFANGWLDGGTPLLEMDRGSAMVGASLDWTLADGGATTAAEKSARASLRAARAELDLLLQRIEIEVAGATRTLALSRARLSSAERRDTSAQAALTEIADGFQAGTLPLERWLGAEASAAEASAGAAVAKIRLSLAGTRLALVLGNSLQSELETL